MAVCWALPPQEAAGVTGTTRSSRCSRIGLERPCRFGEWGWRRDRNARKGFRTMFNDSEGKRFLGGERERAGDGDADPFHRSDSAGFAHLFFSDTVPRVWQ